MSARPLALAVLLAAAAGTAHAQDRRAQYRILKLADGREITAEILATEATGLRLRTPQGEMLLPFELLRDMAVADADQFNLQEAWFVYVAAPPTHQDRLLEAFRWVPTTRVARTGESLPGLAPEVQSAAGKCKLDFPCLLEATKDSDWMFVVSVQVAEDGSIVANSAVNTGPNVTRTRVEKPDATPESLWHLAYEALQLEVPDGEPPESAFAVAAPETPPDRADPVPEVGAIPDDKLVALAFAPVPGLAAARQKNGAGVGTALALTAAGTAAWIGAVGHTAQSAPELVGLGAVGFYATTVFANQVTIRR